MFIIIEKVECREKGGKEMIWIYYCKVEYIIVKIVI